MIDPPERVEPNHIIVVEGYIPYMMSGCVALDFSVYLDISDDQDCLEDSAIWRNGATATKMSWLRSTLDALILTPTLSRRRNLPTSLGIAYAVD